MVGNTGEARCVVLGYSWAEVAITNPADREVMAGLPELEDLAGTAGSDMGWEYLELVITNLCSGDMRCVPGTSQWWVDRVALGANSGTNRLVAMLVAAGMPLASDAIE